MLYCALWQTRPNRQTRPQKGIVMPFLVVGENMEVNLPCVSKHIRLPATADVQQTGIDLILWPDDHNCKQCVPNLYVCN